MIIVEISGGVLCGVYTDVESDVVVVDWDNIDEDEEDGEGAPEAEYAPNLAISDMDAETAEIVGRLTSQDSAA